MTQEELQIGDWLYRPDCYDRVVEIRLNGIIGQDSNRGLIPFSELKPIEITPEILEKNFEKDPNWIDGYKLNHDVHIYKLMVWNIEYMDLVAIRYVHELQHALRLCKIEKEIIL